MALTTSKAQLLDDLRHEQAQFEALLDEIGEEHMTQPTADGEWSIKDIVAHLTSWRRRTVGRFQAALRHEPQPAPPWPSDLQNDDEINAWFYATDRDKPVSVVLHESREVFDRLVETLAAFPEADLHDSANFPWLAGEPWNGAELFGHFHDEHEADMRAWLDKVRSAEQ
ncbi:MAG TPA: DinB family protein [Ktedonobacterales bacterium]|nr:DinB family protein [Ktedonobacterales bacterium]